MEFDPASPVELAGLDDRRLAELLELAMSDADPAEVMAPLDGDPGWTSERIEAFCTGHRACRYVAEQQFAEITLAVVRSERVARSARRRPVCMRSGRYIAPNVGYSDTCGCKPPIRPVDARLCPANHCWTGRPAWICGAKRGCLSCRRG
jgi:hypothetical protein